MAFRAACVLLVTAATAVPDVATSDWCAWVPLKALSYVPGCNGTNVTQVQTTKGCATWCPWVPKPAWKEVPDCGVCNSGAAIAAAAGEAAAEREPEMPSSRLKVKAQLQAPIWCRYVPLGSQRYVRDCGGNQVPQFSRAEQGCSSWCQWVPQGSWQYTPDCRSCGGAGTGPATPTPVAPASPTAQCVGWCSYVPSSSWQYTSECHGCSGQGPATGSGNTNLPGTSCASWCQWVPGSSWQYTPACRTCSQDLEALSWARQRPLETVAV